LFARAVFERFRVRTVAGSEDKTNRPGSRAPPCVRSPVRRPLARTAAATIARSRRARRLRGPVARFEALLPSEVRSLEDRAARSSGLAPEPRSPLGPRAVALLVFSPSEAF